jgi:hypothetical protein
MAGMLVSLAVLLAAEASALGSWTANGARLELKDEGGKVVGRLAAPGGPCPGAAGDELLRGQLLDDSLSAQVRLCLLAESCGASADTAFAVLLVTKTLTGGVHTKAACAQEVHSLVLRRPGAAKVAMAAPKSTERLSKAPPPPPKNPPPPAAGDKPAPPKNEKFANVSVGEIPNRPVGDARHPDGYDPRDARNKDTPKGAVERLLNEGAGYLGDGRFERARASFREAVEKDPQRAEAYNGVGVTFYARADYDEALAWYKRALEANPDFGDAFYNMACVYAVTERKDLALRYLRLAALNSYAQPDSIEKDGDLASLRDDPLYRQILDQLHAESNAHP